MLGGLPFCTLYVSRPPFLDTLFHSILESVPLTTPCNPYLLKSSKQNTQNINLKYYAYTDSYLLPSIKVGDQSLKSVLF